MLIYKYAGKDFGMCPLIQCAGQPVLPVGLKDDLGVDTVKIYCPKCSQVYHPPPIRSSRTGSTSGVDGAAFGTTFPHLFLMTFNNLSPTPLPVESTYVPRVFGFRVHQTESPSCTPRPIIVDGDDTKNANGDSSALKADVSDPSDALMRAAKRKAKDDGNGTAPPFLLESAKRRKKSTNSSNND